MTCKPNNGVEGAQSGTFRLRRALLFVPGERPDRIKKIVTMEADVVVIDLEDAVAPEQKGAARQSVKQALAEVEFGQKECVVRINSVFTLNGIKDLVAIKDFSRHQVELFLVLS